MRNKYVVEITETLQRQITVFSESEDRALDIIHQKYNNYNIVLDSSDFIDYEVSIVDN